MSEKSSDEEEGKTEFERREERSSRDGKMEESPVKVVGGKQG